MNFSGLFCFLLITSSATLGELKFIRSQKSKPQLVFNGYLYNKKITFQNGNTNWRCADAVKYKCFANCIVNGTKLIRCKTAHKHPPQTSRILKSSLYATEPL